MTLYYQVKREHVWTSLVDEVVVLHSEKGEYYSFDSVAALIWQTLQEPKSLEELSDKIQAAYEVSKEECEKDLIDFIELLDNNKFIVKFSKD
jgi:hypothetical protein